MNDSENIPKQDRFCNNCKYLKKQYTYRCRNTRMKRPDGTMPIIDYPQRLVCSEWKRRAI